MRIFLDTSAWIKYFIAEEGTQAIQEFLIAQAQKGDNDFLASAVTYAEMYATLTRAHKARRITSLEQSAITDMFEAQWANIVLPEVNNKLILQAGRLAQAYALRGCDAFQLASALALSPDIFISCDADLNRAAQQENLNTWNPTAGKFI